MQRKILVVDDQPEVRDAIQEAINGDCIVLKTGRGDEALDLFLRHEPHAVILDVEIEGCLQGTHLLRLLKKGYPEVPVVMMSGRYDLKKELLRAGADHFFDKPFDLFEVRRFFQIRGFFNSIT